MMSLFPGVARNPLMQPVNVKNLFYQMTPGEWHFLNSGQVITNNDYTLLARQRFMTLQEEQNQADMARPCQQQQKRMGHHHAGCQGRSQGCRYATVDGGSTALHCWTAMARPTVPPAQQALVAAQPFYHGFPRPPYQGQ